MRFLTSGLAFMLLTGANCLWWPVVDWRNPGDMPADVAPARCHSGTFQCADGPILTECGAWFFDLNEGDAVIGAGEITGVLPSAPVQVILSGIVDSNTLSVQITVTSDHDGNGIMNLGYDGPTLEWAGDWSFSDEPEPAGTEVSGQLTGTSCASLW
jgi:hypothetical protein